MKRMIDENNKLVSHHQHRSTRGRVLLKIAIDAAADGGGTILLLLVPTPTAPPPALVTKIALVELYRPRVAPFFGLVFSSGALL